VQSQVGKIIFKGTEISSEKLYVKGVSMLVGLPEEELKNIVETQNQQEDNNKVTLYNRSMRAKQILNCLNNLSVVTGIPPLSNSGNCVRRLQ
jgi:hypothetical protein